MSFVLTSAIANALTDEVIARGLAMMDNTNYLDREKRKEQANDNIAHDKGSNNLPAVDALIAGTIGLGLNHQADKLESSLSHNINMDALLAGSDFKKPTFVMAMKDMGTRSPSVSPYASPNVRSMDIMLAA